MYQVSDKIRMIFAIVYVAKLGQKLDFSLAFEKFKKHLPNVW